MTSVSALSSAPAEEPCAAYPVSSQHRKGWELWIGKRIIPSFNMHDVAAKLTLKCSVPVLTPLTPVCYHLQQLPGLTAVALIEIAVTHGRKLESSAD